MMHPQLRIDLVRAHARALEQAALRARLVATEPAAAPVADEPVALRLCRVSDDDVLERLATLEGRQVPSGRFLVAEVRGEIVAALPLLGGEPLRDPFKPTMHLLPLLKLRAAQLDDQPRARIEAAKAIAARMLHPAR
jgi:hypothetical protein